LCATATTWGVGAVLAPSLCPANYTKRLIAVLLECVPKSRWGSCHAVLWRKRHKRILGPDLTRQLALRIIRAKGLSESDKVLAQTIALRVVQTLHLRARRFKVVCQTKTKGVCVWRLPAPGERPFLTDVG
jgi:hypothetical protein